MSAKGKERASNFTKNTTVQSIITAIIFTVQAKDTYPRVKPPNTFLSDRKKFKAYETQCRMYL
jgi:hypothetical protein